MISPSDLDLCPVNWSQQKDAGCCVPACVVYAADFGEGERFQSARFEVDAYSRFAGFNWNGGQMKCIITKNSKCSADQ